MGPLKINTETHKNDTRRKKVSRKKLSTITQAHIETAGKSLRGNHLDRMVRVLLALSLLSYQWKVKK